MINLLLIYRQDARRAYTPVFSYITLMRTILRLFAPWGDALHRWGKIDHRTPNFTPNTDL